jgi:hypothetical protein
VSAGTTRGRGLGAASLPADGDPDGDEGDAESEVAGGLEDLAQPASTKAKDKRDKVPAIRERLIEFLRITSSFFEDTPIIADVNRVVRVFRGLVPCFAALPSQTESGRGDYVVDFGEKSEPLNVHETRTPLAPTDVGKLSAIVDKGLPVLAFVFYPAIQDDYEMSCEGSAERNSHPGWVVHFRQVKGKHPRTVSMDAPTELHRLGSTASEVLPLRIKGRAWIAADSGQVMHLETNLLERISVIALEESAVSVEYAPVKFKTQNVEVWLPQFRCCIYGLSKPPYDH